MADETPPGTLAVDTALVRELAELLAETGLTEIEVEHGDRKIRVARGGAPAPATSYAPPAAAAPPPAAAAPEATPAHAETDADAVKSPMVGTAYLKPEPAAAPFVRPGDTVSQGQTVLIVEAMKVMNPISAPRAGKLTKMLVDDGQPIEFDQPLFVIE